MATKTTARKPKTADVLKWLEKSAAKTSERPALTAGYTSNGASYTSNGFVAHMAWNVASDGDWLTFKKTDRDATDGKFPDIWKVLPADSSSVRVELIDVDALVNAVKIAAIFAKDNANSTRFTFTDNGVYVSAKSAERGDVQTVVAFTGNPGPRETHDASLDYEYVLDALSGFSGIVKIELFSHVADKNSEPRYIVTIGERRERLAMIMPLTTNDGASRPAFVPDVTLEPRDYEPGKRATLPAAKTKPAKVAAAVETETMTTDDDGKIHESVRYRRGAAAFADIAPRLTPEVVAQMRWTEAVTAFDKELTSALRASERAHGAARIAHRPNRRAILIAVKNGDTEKIAWAIQWDGLSATLTEYWQWRDSKPTATERARLMFNSADYDIGQHVEALARVYGYMPEPERAPAYA